MSKTQYLSSNVWKKYAKIRSEAPNSKLKDTESRILLLIQIRSKPLKKVKNSSKQFKIEKQLIKYGEIKVSCRDYIIPVCRDEISISPSGTYFTLRLHGKIKFHPSKAGKFSTWYLFRFAYIFFQVYCGSMF